VCDYNRWLQLFDEFHPECSFLTYLRIMCNCKWIPFFLILNCVYFLYVWAACTLRIYHPYVWRACPVRPRTARTSTRATRTASARPFSNIPWSLVLRATYVVSTLSVRALCVARCTVLTPCAFSLNVQKTPTPLPNTYLLRTYNARCVHWFEQYKYTRSFIKIG